MKLNSCNAFIRLLYREEVIVLDKKNAVALIDSGVKSDNPFLRENIIAETSFISSSSISLHGTLCASMMKSIEDEIPIYSVKILNENEYSDYMKLYEAFMYLKNIDAKIINLSLATTNINSGKYLEKICNELIDQGKIIIASVDNQKGIGYPALYKNVLGIRGLRTMSMNEFWFNASYSIQCACDMSPVLVPIGEHFAAFAGTSKATAIMTAIIYGILNRYEKIGNEELVAIIESQAEKTEWDLEKTYLDSTKPPSFKYKAYDANCKELQKISWALSETIGHNVNVKDISKYDSLLRYGINCQNGCKFLEEIEKVCDIKIRIPVQYCRLLSIGAILGLIEEFKGE